MRPYWFKLAASPHLAAARQNQRINIKKIKKSFFALEKKFDKVIVEGTGGVLVPLTAKTTMIDLARQLALPAIIVSQNKLGTINHTLLTIEALKKRKIKILGIIFNTPKNPPEQIIFRNNIEIIRKISKVKILGVLPRQKNKKILTQEFNRIGKRITIVAGERKTH
jgi:dethiobiotin synthetase